MVAMDDALLVGVLSRLRRGADVLVTLHDCSAVAGRVRDDASLSEPLRRAAINLVLKRCSQMRERAHGSTIQN